MADQGDGTGTAWIDPAGGTSSTELGDAAASAPSVLVVTDGNNVPIPLPTPTPQAPYVDSSSNGNGNAAVGGIPSRTKGGFGIPIPPDTRNQGGISLKASEFAQIFLFVRACVYGRAVCLISWRMIFSYLFRT